MKYQVQIGEGKTITLEHDNIEDTVNVDDLTKIDVGNIFGEVVTAPAAANRIGMLKAEVEESLSLIKLDLKVIESNIRAEKRKEAGNNSGSFTIKVGNEDVKVKLTEKALESIHETDEKWLKKKKEFIKAERNVGLLSSLYWAVQDKSRKVGNITGNVTPEEFANELVEGKVNGIFIEKSKTKNLGK